MARAGGNQEKSPPAVVMSRPRTGRETRRAARAMKRDGTGASCGLRAYYQRNKLLPLLRLLLTLLLAMLAKGKALHDLDAARSREVAKRPRG